MRASRRSSTDAWPPSPRAPRSDRAGEPVGDDPPHVGVQAHPQVGGADLDVLDVAGGPVQARLPGHDPVAAAEEGGDRHPERVVALDAGAELLDAGRGLGAVDAGPDGVRRSADDRGPVGDHPGDQVRPAPGDLARDHPAEAPADQRDRTVLGGDPLDLDEQAGGVGHRIAPVGPEAPAAGVPAEPTQEQPQRQAGDVRGQPARYVDDDPARLGRAGRSAQGRRGQQQPRDLDGGPRLGQAGQRRGRTGRCGDVGQGGEGACAHGAILPERAGWG